MKVNYRKIFILLTALVLGVVIVMEARSIKNLDELLYRDSQSNVFQEINIMKEKNGDLREEIDQLTFTLEQLSDQNLVLEVFEEEILKYQKLTGESSIFGPGVEVVLEGDIFASTAIDLSNQFFTAGSQAVSINGIRLTNQTVGFDLIPNGQIYLNGSILSSPYTFYAIGDSSSILEMLELPGGMFDRINASYPDLGIKTAEKDVIQMS